MVRYIRFSALTKAAKCRASIACEEEARITHAIPSNVGNDATALGNAYHAAAELAVATGPDAAGARLEAIAREYAVDEAELSWLWRRLTPQPDLGFPSWMRAESPVALDVTQDLTLRGTPDLVRYFERFRLLEVTDWKSGYLIVDEEDAAQSHAQVRGYTAAAAILARRDGIDVDRARGVIQAPRRGAHQPDAFELVGDEIDEAWHGTAKIAIEADAQRDLPAHERTYRSGRHCRFCVARRDCRAYRSEIDSAVALFSAGSIEITSENAERIYEARVMIGKVRDALDAGLKLAVDTIGTIRTEDGKRELAFRPSASRPIITIEVVQRALAEIRGDTGPEATFTIDGIEALLIHALENREKVESRRFGLYKVSR